MIRLTKWLIVFLLIPLISLADDWRFSKEQEEVVVYERFRPITGFKEFRAEVVVNAKADQIVRLFQKLEKISQWHYQTHSVEVLELINMTQAYLHIVSKPPWPMQSRDLVAYVELQNDPPMNQIKIRLQSTNDEQVFNHRYIRLPKLEAEWSISKLSEGQSQISYQIYSEPGGDIPKWFFNSVAMDVPLYSLINLRQYFFKSEDINATELIQ